MNKKKRGLLAAAGALLTTVAMVVGVGAAQAVTLPNPPDTVNVTITKLEQPDVLGPVASGVQDPAAVGTPIEGVTFSYTLVPGTAAGQANDAGTNAGQNYAADLTVAAARAAISDTPATVLGTTGPDGTVSGTLPRGVYLVDEDVASLPLGVTAAEPFLMTLPMTDPDTLDGWLADLYIYPKSSVISADKTVVNRDVLSIGGSVAWTVTADIPTVANPASTGPSDRFMAPDHFSIADTLTDAELTLDESSVAVNISSTVDGVSRTLANPDAFVATTTPESGSTTLDIEFTETGRAALATAVHADPDAEVVLSFETAVAAAVAITNTALVYPNQDAKDLGRPLPASAEVRYGSATVELTGGADLSGAVFRIYTSEVDALAGGATGRLVMADSTDTWTTGVDGSFTIEGLRLSDWADGAAVVAGSEGYQTYWLVQTTAPEGHQLLPDPIELDLTSVSQTLTIEQAPNTGAFVLPLTGGQGTALLTVAGLAILGFVLVASRRRRDDAAV